MAGILTEHVRGAADLVARYGGEEFALVLPGADAAEAYRVAERARAAIEALKDAHPLAARGYVTVSIGIAAAAVGEPGTPQQLVAAADARLYQAKRAGRNQVTGGPTG